MRTSVVQDPLNVIFIKYKHAFVFNKNLKKIKTYSKKLDCILEDLIARIYSRSKYFRFINIFKYQIKL